MGRTATTCKLATGLMALLVAMSNAGLASAASKQVILLYGPDGPSSVAEERALAAYNLQADARGTAPSIRHMESVFEDVPAVTLVGADEGAACPGSPVEVQTFADGLDRAFEHLAYVETEEANQALQRLDGLLPCLNGVLERPQLARITFLQGVALAYSGATDEARESFRKALVVSPELEWDPAFPPDAKELFTEAIQLALRTTTIELTVAPGLGDGADLWIDGVQFSDSGGVTTVAVGRHLFQWDSGDTGFATRVVDVVEGENLTLYGRKDVMTAALRGSGSDLTVEQAVEQLSALAAGDEFGGLYIAELGEVDLLHRFEHTEKSWELTDQGLVSRRSRARGLSTAGTVTLITGGVMTVVGSLVGVLSYREAMELYDEGETCTNTGEYAILVRDYEKAHSRTYMGVTIAGVGGAALIAGIPMKVSAAKARRPNVSASAADSTVHLHPGPMSLAISGSF